DRINERQEPREQCLVGRMNGVACEGGGVGEFHYAACLIACPARRNVPAHIDVEQTRNLPTKRGYFRDCPILLFLSGGGLPAKGKHVNHHRVFFFTKDLKWRSHPCDGRCPGEGENLPPRTAVHFALKTIVRAWMLRFFRDRHASLPFLLHIEVHHLADRQLVRLD